MSRPRPLQDPDARAVGGTAFMPGRIEDYALVGDCETAALVSQNGFISLRQNTTGGPSEIKAPVALSAIRETLVEGVVQAFRVNRFDTIFMRRTRKGRNGRIAGWRRDGDERTGQGLGIYRAAAERRARITS